MSHHVRRRLLFSLASVLLTLSLSCERAPEAPLGPGIAEPFPGARGGVERILAAARADDRAWARLAEMCDTFGPRPAGSTAYLAAARWAADTMRADGLDGVRLEPVEVEAWERGRESLVLLAPNGPRPLPVTTLGGSVGTPPGGIEADLVVVHDFDELERRAGEVRGKVVLFDHPMEDRDDMFRAYGDAVKYRWAGASRAARHGARAVLVRSLTTRSLRTLHTGQMGYDEDAPRIPAAAITVEDSAMLARLAARGVPLRVLLRLGPHRLGRRPCPNVVAELPGRELPDEVVVVGAHLDSWDLGNGAMDDGGGVILALETARLLRENGLVPRRTIRVVLFAGEEIGGLPGGHAYVEAHREELDRHVAALESDAGTFRPTGFSVRAGDEARERLARYVRLIADGDGLELREGGGGPDVSPLGREGVPVIGLRTDTTHYFDYHHSPADMPEAVPDEDLRESLAVFAAMAWLVAEAPDPLPRAPEKP